MKGHVARKGRRGCGHDVVCSGGHAYGAVAGLVRRGQHAAGGGAHCDNMSKHTVDGALLGIGVGYATGWTANATEAPH